MSTFYTRHTDDVTMQELQRQIDYDRKLRDFMNRKNQERAGAHMEIEARKMRKEVEKTSTRERTVLVRICTHTHTHTHTLSNLL